MMQKEFEELTGVFLPSEMYAKVIEPAYMKSDMNKQAFCKCYRQNTDGLAEKLQGSMDLMLWRQKENAKADVAGQELLVRQAREKIKKLTERLEEEQEWKPYVPKDVYKAYNNMALDPALRKMDVREARKLVAEIFGFSPEKVEVLTSLPKYEINRHNVIRKAEEKPYPREPLYCATDYNYVLFRVCGQDYECVDGEIYVVDL